jgi:cytochrome oxidase Cu insertion factor (SCO1/SenC/PrrC family)
MKHFISCVLVMLLFAVAISGQQRRRASVQSQKPVAQYSCSMHPAINASAAGRCPKCGMNLVRAKPENGRSVVGPRERSMSIPDVELLNHDGRKVHFYSDLVKGRTVAINFIFTTCTTICPPMGATFARVQKELKNLDTHLISISVDPVTDTPERLKAWGAKFKAEPRWTFVTGDKQKIDELLRALAASTARPADHSPTIIIGNDAMGQWTRAYGLARPSQIVQIIEKAANGQLKPDTNK